MNTQPPAPTPPASAWNTVLSLVKRYWWIYPLWWILKLGAVALFGMWITE